MSFNDEIHNSAIMKSPFSDEELFMIVLMTFFPFITFGVISLLTPSGVRTLFLTLVSFLIVFTIRIPSVISSGWNFQLIHMFIQIF